VFVPGKPLYPGLFTGKAGAFVPGKPLYPGLFAGKAGAYPSEALFGCSTLGKAPGLTYKIGLGLIGLPGINTLAYYENP
jgi:hypothetical protein